MGQASAEIGRPRFLASRTRARCGGAEVLAMDPGAGELGEQDVAGDDHFLAAEGQPADPGEVPIAFVHDAVGDKRVILAMIHDGQVEHLGVFAGARMRSLFCTQWPSSVMAMTPAFFKPRWGEFLAGDALGDGAGDEDVDAGFGLGAFADEGDIAGVVNGGRCWACRRWK